MNIPAGMARDPAVIAITSAYVELAAGHVCAADAREICISAGISADVERLFAVGRAVRDAQPWIPFLARLRAIAPKERTTRSGLAEQRLYQAASEMLRLQGLELVRPEDCLARLTQLEEAIAYLGSYLK
jgi:hypothetical protein